MSSYALDTNPPPPGSRVRARGEEWAVQKCLPLPTGGYAVHVQGLSELVRHHQAIFLTTLDTDIEPLRPEDTRLVPDPSPGYRQTTLYLETLLRRTPPVHDRIAIGHRGALDVMPYQLVPAQQSLASLRPRILIADGTGLGKTIELGIILTELIKRGRGRRILVVAIRSMLAQLQRELWARFTLPLVRLDSEGLVRVQAKVPANRNPFSYFDRCIVSMDTLKNNGLYRAWLEQIRWDVIVVDECHNVANQASQRGDLARLLAAQADALVLTSATPHNGKPESFANLMRMLDPTSVADPRSFTRDDVKHLFVRRFKKDVAAEARDQLQTREVATLAAPASEPEERALAALHALELSTLGDKSSRKDALAGWTLIKGFLSSPAAALESIDNRLKVTTAALDRPAGPHPRAAELQADTAKLGLVRELVVDAQATGSGKLEALFAELARIGFDGSVNSPRIVIFSERICTLEMLREAMTTRFKMKPEQLETYTASGGTQDLTQREIIESFGHADSKLRVLLCSDAASEGVNLHHQCHRLFHYDVPWSLIRLTQRNGRVDRFGQHHVPQLRYLVTESRVATSDQRIIKRLIEKEKEVEKQLGDSGALLGLFDAEAEESYVTRGAAAGMPVEQLIPDRPMAVGKAASVLPNDPDAANAITPAPVAAPAIDLLAMLADIEAEQARSPALTIDKLVTNPASLFENDYDLLVAALRQLENHPVIGPEPIRWSHVEATASVEIHAPEPFRRHRESFLPREAVPPRGSPYRLAMGRELVASKLRTALDDEGRWPDWHLLWEQHPLVEWLLDALGAAYARGEAPLLRVPSVGAGRALFLLQGMMFNHESEAVEARWLGLPVDGKNFTDETLDLAAVIARVGLQSPLVNSGQPSARAATLQALVPAAVAAGRTRVTQGRKEHVKAQLLKRVRSETRRLEAWAARCREIVAAELATWAAKERRVPRHIEDRLRREQAHIAQVERNHQQLLSSVQAVGEPYLRVVAVFAGD